jgi:hypothetical protein
MATPNWNKLPKQNTQYLQDDFLTEKDRRTIAAANDKRIAYLYATAGRNNHFPTNAYDVLPEERKKYKDMYFSQPDVQRMKMDISIQDAFTNSKQKEIEESALRAKEATKIKEIQEAANSGIVMPDGVNFFSAEGKAHIERQANNSNLSVNDYIKQSKETKISTEKDEQNDFIRETANIVSNRIMNAIKANTNAVNDNSEIDTAIKLSAKYIAAQVELSMQSATKEMKEHTSGLIEKIALEMAGIKLEEGEGEGEGAGAGAGAGKGGGEPADDPPRDIIAPDIVLSETAGSIGKRTTAKQESGNVYVISIMHDDTENPFMMTMITSIKLEKDPDTYIIKGKINGKNEIAHIKTISGDKTVQLIAFMKTNVAKELIKQKGKK